MNIVILDLEWNGAYSRRLHGFINEIIEFGAVKLDAQPVSYTHLTLPTIA